MRMQLTYTTSMTQPACGKCHRILTKGRWHMICTENTIKNTIYSVGTDKTLSLKEKIADVHGANSKVMKAANELDRYVADPETRESSWYWNFYSRVRSGMWCLYPNSNDMVKTQMARKFIDEIFNGGYIRALRSLAGESGAKNVIFARDYADGYGVSIGAALLFGPRGGASMELLHFLAAERIHGQHRHGSAPNPKWSEQARKRWYDAGKIGRWPTIRNENGESDPLDLAEEQGRLPDGIVEVLRETWRRNPALRGYSGIKRLPCDTPFQIVEDVVDIVIRNGLSSADRARYDRIIDDANKQGIDPFYAVYRGLFANKDRLRPYWDMARKLLCDYSISLWEARNATRLEEGKPSIPSGVNYKSKPPVVPKSRKSKVPGTIYLNNGGYYWCVAGKMKPRPLIDSESKPKVPGSFIVSNGRYYWHIPGWVKRHRLVPKGEVFSTKDEATALKIAKKLWNRIKKNNPELAANVRKHTRVNGIATKDRAVAEKVAVKLWKQIQRGKPGLAAKLFESGRAEAKEHWYAQITVGRKYRFLGSFETKAEAEAAYAKAFEEIWGYPPFYSVRTIPRLDKVWPAWSEEKTRLALMDEHPRMPVVGKPETLKPLIQRMQRVDWIVDNCIVVLDDNSPVASKEVAVESRGEKWYVEIKKQCKRAVIKGSTSIDKDTGRIRITVYGQGFSKSRVLTEEVYHVVFEIIRHASPKTFASIKKWYSNRLKHELDPTWMIHEAFAELMVQETEFPESTDLPRNVVNYAQRVFSTRNIVPKWTMKKVLA